MSYLLDTNVAIGFAERRLGGRERLRALDAPQLISIVTIVELQGGIASDPAQRTARRRALNTLLRLFEVLPLNEAVADAYGAIVQRIGFSRPRTLDRLIAATAIVHDLTVVTTNGPDFAGIPDLKLEVWPRAAQ